MEYVGTDDSSMIPQNPGQFTLEYNGQEIPPFFYRISGYITYLCQSNPASLHLLSQTFHLTISRITIMQHSMLSKAPYRAIFCNSVPAYSVVSRV